MALDVNQVKRMLAKGMNKSEIAKKLGVSRPTIYRVLQEDEEKQKKRRNRTKEEELAEIEEKKSNVRPGGMSVKGAMQSLDRYNTATNEEISGMMKSVVKWYGRSSIKTNEELASRLNEYFATIVKTGEMPTVEKMALALGVTIQTVDNWTRGVKCDADRTRLIKQARQALAALEAELAMTGKLPQVVYIFRAKNFHGMRDQTDVVVTPNNPIGAEISEEELRRRIAGDVIIDDADFVDIE